MAKATISTKGMEKFLEEVAAAGKDVDAAADRALRAAGGVLKGGMRRRAPKDTRNLERHIDFEGPSAEGQYRSIRVGVVGADAETERYGQAQEFGTASMPAQPYVRPTVDEDRKLVNAAIKKAFGRFFEGGG